jgi:hypothetical protein
MISRIQQAATRMNMSYDDFISEIRERGCCEQTAHKIWNGCYESYESFADNNLYLRNLRKASDVLKVKTGSLIPRYDSF